MKTNYLPFIVVSEFIYVVTTQSGDDEGFYDHITYDHHFDYGVQTYVSDFIANLKKAMRPQQ